MTKGSFRVLSLRDRDVWKKGLAAVPEELREPYYLPEYYGLIDRRSSYGECFVYELGGDLLLYPYLKTHINDAVDFTLKGDLYDIESPAPAGGFAATRYDAEFLKGFSKSFCDYCGDNGIIAESASFSPLSLRAHGLPEAHWECVRSGVALYVDLSRGAQEAWTSSVDRSRRKNLRKAERDGVRVECLPGSAMDLVRLDKFIDLYYVTMMRNGADERFFYDDNYFNRICSTLGQNSLFATAWLGTKPIACELVLLYGRSAHAFLAGGLTDFYHHRPNDALKHAVMAHLEKLGITSYCLGGGIRGNDSVYRFKKAFAVGGETECYRGTRIHNRKAYETVCRTWEQRYPARARQFAAQLFRYRL